MREAASFSGWHTPNPETWWFGLGMWESLSIQRNTHFAVPSARGLVSIITTGRIGDSGGNCDFTATSRRAQGGTRRIVWYEPVRASRRRSLAADASSGVFQNAQQRPNQATTSLFSRFSLLRRFPS